MCYTRLDGSYLQIIENVSPPKRFAHHLFFTTANFSDSHLNFAFKLVCKARAIPSMINKSTCCASIASLSSAKEFNSRKIVNKSNAYSSCGCVTWRNASQI